MVTCSKHNEENMVSTSTESWKVRLTFYDTEQFMKKILLFILWIIIQYSPE